MSTKNTSKNKKKHSASILKKRLGSFVEVSDTEKYRDLFHRASAGIFIVEPKSGKILDFNPRFLEILGIKSKTTPSKSIWGLKHAIDPTVIKEISKKVFEEGKARVSEITVHRADNEIIYCGIDAAKVMDGNKNVIQVIMRDVTERKRLMDELESANRELEQQFFRLEKLYEFQNQFFSNLAREFETRLNSITGFAEILRGECNETLKPEHQMQIEAILRNGMDLIKLVHHVLDWAQITSGHMVLEKTPVNLGSILEDIKISAAPFVRNKRVELKTEIQKSIPLLVADPYRLKQIFSNLVDNALKFTEKGYVQVKAAPKGKKFIEVTIEDTGIGIQPEHLDTIFEPFQEIAGDYPAWKHGTGLGLSITKRLVELHKGEINVSSQVGEGTKFIVRFPLDFQSQMRT